MFNACEQTSTITPIDDITLGENESKNFIFDEKNIQITTLDVQESRCPENANCIRAGEVIVTFDIEIEKQLFEDQKLCIGCQEEQSFEIGQSSIFEYEGTDYTLELSSVLPYPHTDNVNKAKSIVFKMQ